MIWTRRRQQKFLTMEDDLVNNISFMTEMDSHMENALREGDSDI